MLFDAQDILTRQSTEFSEGNLAKYPSTGNDSEFFDNIPFKEVYHDDRFDKAQRDNIVFRRHAEVMIPTELDLSALRFVGCRTQAEYETLMFLLTEESRAQWSGKIGLSSRMNLHNRMWTFVEQAVLTPTKVTFTFNPSTLTPGPFSLYFEVVEQATGKSYIYQNASATCSSNLVIALKSLRHPENYSVRLTLDEKLAYSSRYSPSVKPL